jgi:hypothetical protein
MKKNILVVLVLLIPIITHSQNTGGIRILVKDSLTRESIPFVVVQVLNSKLGANSDVNGICLLKNIPTGMQSIQFSAIGYKKATKKLNIEKDELTTTNIFMSPEPVLMQTVTRIAERAKPTNEANISIQTITQDEIKAVSHGLEKDIFKILKILPGISTSGDVTSQFFVRGGGGDQNLILFDNMIIYNPFHALGLFGVFNGESIKASDVITGGFSPEFGSRLSSVINIVGKEGNRNYYGGKVNIGMLSAQAYIEGPVPAGAFSLSFRKSYFDKMLKKFLSKEVPLSFYDFAGKTTFDITDQGKVYFNVMLSGDDITDSRPSQPNYSWNNYSIGTTLQTFFEQFLLNTSISYGSFKTVMDPKAESATEKLNSSINNLFLNIKAEYLFGNNDLLSFGLSMLDQNMDLSYINSSGYYINSSEFLSEATVWCKYKFTYIKNFIAEFGIRENIGNTENGTYKNLEPRLNFKYQITPSIALKSSYTRMHQMMISISNEDDIVSLFEAYVPVSEYFYPERADQYVLGFESRFFDNLNMTFQSYYKSISNFLGYNLNRKSKSDPDFVSGKGESYGCEFMIKYNTNNYFGWITYNLNWVTKTLEEITYPPRYDKRHSLNVCFGTKLPWDIDLSLNFEGSTGMPFTPLLGLYNLINLVDIPSSTSYIDFGNRRTIFGNKNSKRLPFYHKMDINLSRSFVISGFPKINVMFDIINLYDQKNIFYYDITTGERMNMIPFLPSLSIGAEL